MRYVDLFEFQVRAQPEASLITDNEISYTYVEGDRRANQLANALSGVGLEPQQRVAILAENTVDTVILDIACAKAGMVLVPLNYRLAPPEWVDILNDADAKLLIVDPQYVESVQNVRDRLVSTKIFVRLGATAQGDWQSLDDLIDSAPDHRPTVAVQPDWIQSQVYTSGTTGVPKGVLHTHEAMARQMSQQAQLLAPTGALARFHLIAAPLYHAGTGFLWRTHVCFGGPVLIHRRFVPALVLEAFRTQPIGSTLLVPAMIQACLLEAEGTETNYAVSLIEYGGSSISETVLRKAIAVFGCDFLQEYGLTETLCTIALLPDDHRKALTERPEILTAAGRPLAGVTIRIVGNDGRDLAPREVGEVYMRGPCTMVGYWNQPETTATTVVDGWVHTGDAGFLDEDGYLYIHDRIKDMIVSGAENVYPSEVEAALYAHPAIADVAVIGVPHERWGEAVKAVVVLRPGHATSESDLLTACRERIAAYKTPKSVDFVEELPRNASGKLLKWKLRETYWTGHDRRI